MIKITIPGRPITKKNSGRIVTNRKTGKNFLLPSQRFSEYQEMAGWYIPRSSRVDIQNRVNVKCLYYMPTHGLADLTNLEESTDDILVFYGVLHDDNSRIVAGHDGSRVLYDKENPRVEIEIEDMIGEPI